VEPPRHGRHPEAQRTALRQAASERAAAPGRIFVGQTQHQVRNLVADRRATGPVRVGREKSRKSEVTTLVMGFDTLNGSARLLTTNNRNATVLFKPYTIANFMHF
jgi:hypothetical protein